MGGPRANRNLPHPRRPLAFFLALVVGLYGLLIALDVTSSPHDASIWKPHLGLDLQGGTRITLQAKNDTGGKITPDKLAEARGIIDKRVNATGVAEAEVTTQGGNQVIIEIPGANKAGIVDQVGKTAQLRFRLVWATGTSAAATTDTSKQQAVIDSVDWSKLTLDQLLKAETDSIQTLPPQYQDAVKALQAQMSGFVCNDETIVNDVASEPLVTCDPSTGEVQLLSPAVIEGTDVKSAEPAIPQQSVDWVVAIALKGKGKKTFDTVTRALFDQERAGNSEKSRFAIVLDGKTISAPTTNGHFIDGKSQISGSFTSASAKQLADQLRYGALPLSFELNGSSYEGPTLAGTQLNAGLIAGAIGMALVVVYLMLYYRGLSLIAIGSLVAAAMLTYSMVLLLGKGMGFTLTLPGIAGLIVAIGITADSFIVYFERLRDEVRDGKSLRLAVEAGWERARATILAADAVSFLAAVVLYIFAIGVVRGFAFALGLTTLVDVLIVFIFTKPLMTLAARTKFFGQGHKLSGLDADHLGITGRKVNQTGHYRAGEA